MKGWAETGLTDFQVKMGDEGRFRKSQHITSSEMTKESAVSLQLPAQIPASEEDQTPLLEWISDTGNADTYWL